MPQDPRYPRGPDAETPNGRKEHEMAETMMIAFPAGTRVSADYEGFTVETGV